MLLLKKGGTEKGTVHPQVRQRQGDVGLGAVTAKGELQVVGLDEALITVYSF